MSEDVHPREPDRIEETPEPRRQLSGAQPPQPRQLHEMKPTVLRKALHERRPPAPRARQTVHHHQILTPADDPVAHRFPVDLDTPQLHTTSVNQMSAPLLTADGSPALLDAAYLPHDRRGE